LAEGMLAEVLVSIANAIAASAASTVAANAANTAAASISTASKRGTHPLQLTGPPLERGPTPPPIVLPVDDGIASALNSLKLQTTRLAENVSDPLVHAATQLQAKRDAESGSMGPVAPVDRTTAPLVEEPARGVYATAAIALPAALGNGEVISSISSILSMDPTSALDAAAEIVISGVSSKLETDKDSDAEDTSKEIAIMSALLNRLNGEMSDSDLRVAARIHTENLRLADATEWAIVLAAIAATNTRGLPVALATRALRTAGSGRRRGRALLPESFLYDELLMHDVTATLPLENYASEDSQKLVSMLVTHALKLAESGWLSPEAAGAALSPLLLPLDYRHTSWAKRKAVQYMCARMAAVARMATPGSRRASVESQAAAAARSPSDANYGAMGIGNGAEGSALAAMAGVCADSNRTSDSPSSRHRSPVSAGSVRPNLSRTVSREAMFLAGLSPGSSPMPSGPSSPHHLPGLFLAGRKWAKDREKEQAAAAEAAAEAAAAEAGVSSFPSPHLQFARYSKQSLKAQQLGAAALTSNASAHLSPAGSELVESDESLDAPSQLASPRGKGQENLSKVGASPDVKSGSSSQRIENASQDYSRDYSDSEEDSAARSIGSDVWIASRIVETPAPISHLEPICSDSEASSSNLRSASALLKSSASASASSLETPLGGRGKAATANPSNPLSDPLSNPPSNLPAASSSETPLPRGPAADPSAKASSSDFSLPPHNSPSDPPSNPPSNLSIPPSNPTSASSSATPLNLARGAKASSSESSLPPRPATAATAQRQLRDEAPGSRAEAARPKTAGGASRRTGPSVAIGQRQWDDSDDDGNDDEPSAAFASQPSMPPARTDPASGILPAAAAAAGWDDNEFDF